MKRETTVYADGCIARRHNKRISVLLLKDDSIGIEIVNMQPKVEGERPPLARTEIKRNRSVLQLKISKEGAEALLIALVETLNLKK
jgi:hypothetical protein